MQKSRGLRRKRIRGSRHRVRVLREGSANGEKRRWGRRQRIGVSGIVLGFGGGSKLELLRLLRSH